MDCLNGKQIIILLFLITCLPDRNRTNAFNNDFCKWLCNLFGYNQGVWMHALSACRCTKPNAQTGLRICEIKGDPHWRTFDGKKFPFQGYCTYNVMIEGDFTVSVTDTACGRNGVTCIQSVDIISRMNSTTNRFTMNRDGTVYLNAVIQQLPVNANGVHISHIEPGTPFAKLDNGAAVELKGRCARIYTPTTLVPKGMCGNNDNNKHNDFQNPAGEPVPNANAFGNSWKANPSCPDV